MAEFDEPLAAALAQVQRAISGPALEAVLASACQPMLEQARRFAPVRTGELKRNIELKSRHTVNKATVVVQVADSGKGGQYHEAVFAEFGTARQAARPFMRPAFAAHKNAIQAAVEQHLTRALRD